MTCPGPFSKSGTEPGAASGQVRVLHCALQNAVAKMGLTAGLSRGFSVSFYSRPVETCVLKREMEGRGDLSGMHCINNIWTI